MRIDFCWKLILNVGGSLQNAHMVQLFSAVNVLFGSLNKSIQILHPIRVLKQKCGVYYLMVHRNNGQNPQLVKK